MKFLILFFVLSCSTLKKTTIQDPYLWLEDIESPKSLEFAKNENEKTFKVLKNDPKFLNIEKEIREIVLAKDRVPWAYQMKGKLYNFWKDEANPKGLWRRTDLKSYKTDKPNWEIILNLDEISKTENENWVWHGSSCLPPKFEKCLIYLSRGGKDAHVIREFDLKSKNFVKGGFALPEAKSSMNWIDDNTVYVGTDLGADSLTTSGYARIIKIWHRGENLKNAKQVFEVSKVDMSAHAYVNFSNNRTYHFFDRTISFYENENWYVEKGEKYKIPMPTSAKFNGIFKEYLLFEIRSTLKTFKAGSLVALPLKSVVNRDTSLSALELIFEPTPSTFLEYVDFTKNYLFLGLMDNVKGELVKVSLKKPGNWLKENLKIGLNNGVISIDSTENTHDNVFVSYTDFITPTVQYVGNATESKIKFKKLKTSPARFSSDDLITEQKFSTSKDGTKIPYFLVHKKNIKYDGSNPTLLYGYGGFENAMLPFYLNATGKAWVEKGGVYVLANLRGGGEFGPAWHEATVKEKHQNAFDDFISIAEDLIKTKVTSSAHLGIQGGSNGGLLTGATFVQRPDLFNAVICEVPLLDMLRFNKLLAGASWMDEYGNPDDPKDREYILKYSPYQNVKAGIKYPEVFFLTNTKDDRVHPGHARKMVAKMRAQGHPVFYFENIEGGHGGAASLEQIIFRNALNFTYLWKKLGNQ